MTKQASTAAAQEEQGGGGSHHELFNDDEQAQAYAKNRIKAPQVLLNSVLGFYADGSGSGAAPAVALDIACGSGQATIELAARLAPGARVIGQDGSEAQLSLAPKMAAAAGVCNIVFEQADAHATGLPAGSVDLVTVAQALHWLELSRFYREVRRVMNPERGVFAAWCYQNPILVAPDHPANLALHRVYEGVLGEYWSPLRKHVEDGYKNLAPAVPGDFGVCERRQLEVSDKRSVDDIIGLVKSWSSYQTYRRAHPGDADDPLPGLRAALLAALGVEDGAARVVDVVTPIALLLAKEPRPV